MTCPNCGAQGGGPAGCDSCGLGRDPNVGRHINAGQDQIEQRQRSSNRDCFPGDANVRTPAGERRIDSIRKGDSVLGVTATGTVVSTTVKRICSHDGAHQLLRVVSSKPELSFYVTKRHPIQTTRGWLRVRDVRPGDVLSYVDSGGNVLTHTVQCVELTSRYEPVYNLTVDGDHTFIVHGCIAHSFVYFRILRCCLDRLRSVLGWRFSGRLVPALRN